MKKKVFNQKLSLKKETISKLDNVEMQSINGGSSWICVSAAAAGAFVEGHEASYWACGFTHGGGGGDIATGANTCDVCVA